MTSPERAGALQEAVDVVREALESAQAGIWDSYYGKGLAVEYARSVDSQIRLALDALARLRAGSAEQAKEKP